MLLSLSSEEESRRRIAIGDDVGIDIGVEDVDGGILYRGGGSGARKKKRLLFSRAVECLIHSHAFRLICHSVLLTTIHIDNDLCLVFVRWAG